MGLPFQIVQGTIFIADKYGNIVDTVKPFEDKSRLLTQATIQGANDPYLNAHVLYSGGIARLATTGIVQIEQLFGFDPFPDNYIVIENTGALNDLWNIVIAGTNNDPTTPDRDAPAVDLDYYVQAGDVGDEIKLRDSIITALNNDTNFKASMKAQAVKDLAIIHIYSKFRGEFYERPVSGDFDLNVTGSASGYLGYLDLKMHGKQTALSRDPNYPHLLGNLGISGQVTSVPQAIGKLCIVNAENGTHGKEMNKDGSVTPIYYTIDCIANEDRFVKELRFYGSAAGIKFGQFLNKNAPLASGIEVKIKSDDDIAILPIIKDTEGFQAEFALGRVNFQFFAGAGLDNFLASFQFEQPFPIRKTGTFPTDDYVQVSIRDDLTQVAKLRLLSFGYRES